MKDRFKAVMVRKDADKQTVEDVEIGLNDLMDGDVVVAVSHSTVNYKDGLVLTGRAPVVRKFPMIAGIDLAGTVETSSHPQFKPGDKVITDGQLRVVSGRAVRVTRGRPAPRPRDTP